MPLLKGILGTFLFVFSHWAYAADLASLEAITAKHSTIASFLSNEADLRAYESQAIQYFGRRTFGCRSFAQVVDEVRSVAKRDPSLAEPLWDVVEGKLDFWIETRPAGERFLLRRPKRVFHSLWSESEPRRCPPKDCQDSDPLSPQRWSAAVQGSVWLAVEKDGAFTGSSVLMLPMSHGVDSLYVATVMGRAMNGKAGMYRFSSSGSHFTGTLLQAIAVGARAAGWVQPKSTVATISSGHPNATSQPRLVEVASMGAQTNDLGELASWKITDSRAIRLSEVSPRVCRPLSGKAGDLLSAYGGPAPLNNPLTVGRGLASVPEASPADSAVTQMMLNIAFPNAKVPSAEKTKEYQFTLGKALQTAAEPLDRARAAYALSGLPSTSQISKGGALPKKPQEGSDALLDRAMRGDTDPGVKAYSAFALAQRGFDSPEIRSGLGAFDNASGNHGNSLNLNSDRRLPSFDPVIRDINLAGEKNERDIPIPADFAKRALDNIAKERDKEKQESRMDRLLDLYFKTKDPSWLYGSLSYLAKEDPEFAKAFIDRANAQASKACKLNKQDEGAKQ